MISTDDLRDVLLKTRAARLMAAPGWETYLHQWAVKLNQFVEAYHNRFGETIDPIGYFQSIPAKVTAFFELDTLGLSTGMQIAVWRILLGCDITELFVESTSAAFHLRIRLQTPYGELDNYTSNFPDDVKLIRHLGTISVNGIAKFQGYHAFAQ